MVCFVVFAVTSTKKEDEAELLLFILTGLILTMTCGNLYWHSKYCGSMMAMDDDFLVAEGDVVRLGVAEAG
jgi:hypothetical protein